MGSKHQLFLDLDIKDIHIASKDVVFMVYRGEDKFGEIRLSQGGVVWRGRDKKDGRKLGWARFDKILEENGRRAERRRPGSRVGVPKRKRQ